MFMTTASRVGRLMLCIRLCFYSSLQIGDGDIIDISWSIDDGVPCGNFHSRRIRDSSNSSDYTEEQPDIAPDDLAGLILHMDRTSINYLSEGGLLVVLVKLKNIMIIKWLN